METKVTSHTLAEYVHLPQDKDIGPDNRNYRGKEEIIEYKGKNLLYLKVECGGDLPCCCCGRGAYISHLESVMIPGYVVNWQVRYSDEDGSPVSEVEPVAGVHEQAEIRDIIKQREGLFDVHFL